jgi:hypothetical protein
MSRLALTLAITLLPPSRRAWGDAMRYEYVHSSADQSAFAWGCLGAALKVNVTTGEGWARIGFGAVLLLSFWLGAYLTYWTINAIFNDTSKSSLTIAWTFASLGFVLFPIVFGLAALKAIQAPLDRFHLAKAGYTMTFRCLLIMGSLQALLTALSLVSIVIAKTRHEQLETSVLIGLVSAILLLCVAWFARHSVDLMRNAAAFALLLCISFFAGITVLMPRLTDSIGHDWGFTALVLAFLMLMTTIAGALFKWMQRPAQSHRQSVP